MDFSQLQDLLTRYLRNRVRNGQWSERHLARLTGFSQPHINLVLKGQRFLSVSAADHILQSLGLSVFDLLTESGEREHAIHALAGYRQVPVAAGSVGPGEPFPSFDDSIDGRLVQAGIAGPLYRPVYVRLAADPEIGPDFRDGDLLLLDQSPVRRRMLVPITHYAIDAGGFGVIRHAEVRGGQLRLRSAKSGLRQVGGHISLAGRNILEVVRGVAVCLQRDLE